MPTGTVTRSDREAVKSPESAAKANGSSATVPYIALLTAGRDRPYALGIAEAMVNSGVAFDFIGSEALDDPILHHPLVGLRNLRTDTDRASALGKVIGVFRYYLRLIIYAVTSRARIFHILWNNKFEWFDRTALMLFYKICGKKLVFTAHNVNIASRDGNDSALNRFTLRMQYNLADRIFVHTEEMRRALGTQFAVAAEKVTVIPFGMNSTVPDTALTCAQARQRLGLRPDERVLLFFGNIAPYKGLEYLVEAMTKLPVDGNFRLVVAGRVKNAAEYWKGIDQRIKSANLESRMLLRTEYIPDEETEIYFKAADVLVLPYKYIFQSGVLFLGYNFGVPVIASDVGSLKEDIVEGETGYVCHPEDPTDLARTISRYFDSSIYRELSSRRKKIHDFAAERYSWDRVAAITCQVYADLAGPR